MVSERTSVTEKVLFYETSLTKKSFFDWYAFL